MNQKGFANIILIVVVAILTGIVGYFTLVKKSPPIVRQTSTPTPTKIVKTVTPTPTRTKTPLDETANWKTTINTNLGYSIKYPGGWKAETNNSGTTLTNLSKSEQVIMIELNSANANPNQLSITEWLKAQQWPDPRPIEAQFKSIGTVGGVSAVEQSPTGTVYFTKGMNVFVVNNGIGFERKVVDEKLFLQILSTFKFTRQ